MDHLTLDLTHHPSDCVGRLFVHNGCEYEIGEWLGTGAERAVYKLINRKSGLCLHVLKVRRWPLPPELLPSQIRNLLASDRSEANFAQIIPVTLDIPGSLLEMQVYVGPYEPAGRRTVALMKVADGLLEIGCFQQAIEGYEDVLALNSAHTAALLNMAAAQSGLKAYANAWITAIKGKEIEPNYLPYRQAVIEYGVAAGYLRFAMSDFMSVKAAFPNVHDLDELGARVYLARGEPERAAELVDSVLVDEAGKRVLQEDIARAISAKSRAVELYMQAKVALLKTRDNSQAHLLLQQAHSVYPEHVLVKCNYALSVARSKEYMIAGARLIALGEVVLPGLAANCYANAAFCFIEAQRWNLAHGALKLAARHLQHENPSVQDARLWDLPSIGIWMDESQWIEGPADAAQTLLARAVEEPVFVDGLSDQAAILVEAYVAKAGAGRRVTAVQRLMNFWRR